MAKYQYFEELPIWQEARLLVKEIYQITLKGGLKTDFGLAGQMQRAAISVMANIAEGFERNSDKDFSRFLDISKSSCGELRSQLYVAFDLGYIPENTLNNYRKKCIRLSRQISGFRKYLKK